MTNIINYGISDTFKLLFVQLKDTPGRNGYKYHSRDVEQICQDLICRNYGSVCYELSFLCWAIVNHPRYASSALLNFFWVEENIKPKIFRQAFSQPIKLEHGKIVMATDYLQLQLGDLAFSISPTRVSVLAVMLEIIASIDPTQLNNIETQLIGADSQKVKQLSSELQKLIYAYLAEHIPKASIQERFRAVGSWLAQRNLTANNLTDEDVLNFWLTPPTQASYIKYATVFNDLLDAVNAIEEVETQFNAEYALSLGHNKEQGEIEAQWVQDNLFEQTRSSEDLNWLCQSPKFLTLTQYNLIKDLLSHQKMLPQLPLSFLRLAIFGNWQAVLVQKKRQSPQALAEKLQQTPKRQYQDYVHDLAACLTQNQQVQQSIAYIFYSLNSPLFVGIMRTQIPFKLQQSLKVWMTEQLEDPDKTQSDYFQYIDLWVSQEPALQAWLNQAAHAFKQNNKEGFKTLPPIEALDLYQDGSDALTQCQQVLERYLSALNNKTEKNSSLENIYRSDLCIFSNRFKQIYGAPHA